MPFRTFRSLRSWPCCAALLSGLLAAQPALASDARCAIPALIGDGWERETPQASGIDKKALCAVLNGVASSKENLHGVVIERHGKLVAELYRTAPDRPINVLYGLANPLAADVDFGPGTLHDVRSIGKSVVSLLLGIALQQGKITTLATPVLDFYPELADLRTPERNAITLAHLLTMSSGMQWDEGGLPNDETRLFWKSEPVRFVLSRAILGKPATAFNYNSGGTAVLADILTRTSGKAFLDLVRAELFAPLGITDWEWVSDLHGRPLAFTGLRMRPRDMAKLGRLVLNHGRWAGRQIIPEAWIAESLRPRISTGFRIPPSATEPLQYGYQWWSGSTDSKGRKLAWSAAFGNGGQRIFVLPELDMSVVITTGAYGSARVNQTVSRLFEQVIAAVNE